MKDSVYKTIVILTAIGLLFITSVYYTNKPDTYDIKSQEHTNKSQNIDKWVNAKEIFVPTKLTFAGEKVPMERTDVFEQLEREIVVNTFYHSQTVLLLKKLPRYFSIIEPILKRNNIPEDFKYLSVAESGLSPTVVSPAGAVGLWQFMRATGKEYKLEVNKEIDERYNIEKSTQAACDYLNKQYKSYKSWTLVAASYNTGRRNVNKQMKRQKANNYFNMLFNEETGRYVYRILALKTILNNPEKYGFYVKNTYPIIKTKKVKIKGRVKDFADFAHKHKISYKTLKNFNPWLRENYLRNKRKKTYYVTIPINRDKFVSK